MKGQGIPFKENGQKIDQILKTSLKEFSRSSVFHKQLLIAQSYEEFCSNQMCTSKVLVLCKLILRLEVYFKTFFYQCIFVKI